MTYPRAIRILAMGTVILFAGKAFIWPLSTLYMSTTLEQSLTTAGLVLLAQQAGALLGNLIGGRLYDLWGAKVSMLLANIVSIPIALAMALWQNFTLYALLLIVLGFFHGLNLPNVLSLTTQLWPDGGRRGMNLIYVAQNVGMAFGAALGGLFASVSMALAFYSNAMTYLLFLLIFILFIKVPKAEPLIEPDGCEKSEQTRNSAALGEYGQGKRVTISILAAGFMLSWLCYSQWASTVSVYTEQLDIQYSLYSLLWTINGSLILLGQPVVAWAIRHGVKTVKQQLTVGILLFGVSMFLIGSSTQYWGFVAAMVIMTFGEMLVWPAVPAIVASLADRGQLGWFQGIISGSATVGRMLGPYFGALLFELWSPQWMYYSIVFLCGVAAFCFYHYDRYARRVPSDQASSSM